MDAYICILGDSPPLGQGPLGPRIDWASRGTFAVLASELNCEGNQASRSAMLVLNASRLRARSCFVCVNAAVPCLGLREPLRYARSRA